MKSLSFVSILTALAVLLAILPLSSAHAYETDQLSERNRVVPDAGARINEYVNAMIERARAKTEKKAKAGWSDEKIANLFRKQVVLQNPMSIHYFGAPIESWMRFTLGEQGYGIRPAHGIYDEWSTMMGAHWNFIRGFSPWVFLIANDVAREVAAQTFMVDGVRFGGDKFSHFFRLGYRYWTRSENGARPDLAIHYGTTTELGTVGLKSIGVFSYADLSANFEGYRFYRDLVDTGADPDRTGYFKITRTEGQRPKVKLERLRAFDAATYISQDWDEYYNPSVYKPMVQEQVTRHLAKYRDSYCAEYSEWKNKSAELPEGTLAPKDHYADLAISPKQGDPFRIAELCR